MGLRWCARVPRIPGLVRLDLSLGLPSPRLHDERHCGAVLRSGVCAIRHNLIYPTIGTLCPCFLIHSCFFPDPYLRYSCLFWCISPHFQSCYAALRDLSHIGTNSVYFISLWFLLQPISSSRGGGREDVSS